MLIPEILRCVPTAEVLVVDDGSPDGTAQAVQEMAEMFPGVHLLKRSSKEGLGRAYVAGFQWALEKGFDWIVQMDADHSHRPQDLQSLLAEIARGRDFVVGSRWIHRGRIANWSWWRWLLSAAGNFYARMLLGWGLHDWTGGFNVWSAKVLRGVELPALMAQGYAFQIELKYRALRLNFKGFEVPILFEERKLGQSKMSSFIIVEALKHVWRLRFKS